MSDVKPKLKVVKRPAKRGLSNTELITTLIYLGISGVAAWIIGYGFGKAAVMLGLSHVLGVGAAIIVSLAFMMVLGRFLGVGQ